MSDTRTRLLETATDLFLRRGYGSVGTNQICSSARVNKGTFYHFFPSKSVLLIAAIEEYAESFAVTFERIVLGDARPSEKLVALFEVPAEANRQWHKANGFAQGCLVGNMALELGTVDPAVRQAVKNALCSWVKTIEPTIAEFARAEKLVDLDIADGARCIITMIQGGLLMSKANNDPSRISDMAPAAGGALRSMARSSEI